MHSPISRSLLLSACAALVLASGGCGQASTGRVSGTVIVTSQGKSQPLKGGFISFISPRGIVKTGKVNDDGQFQLADLPLGEAIVLVFEPTTESPTRIRPKDMRGKAGPADKTPPKLPSVVPLMYSTKSTSPLRHLVTPGDDAPVEFEVKAD